MADFKTSGNENPSPQDVGELVALFNGARYVEAATLADVMTRCFPRHPFGWKALGATLKELGRNADALAPLQKAVTLSPKDAEAHNNLGGALKALGQINEAVTSYRRALAINPDFIQAHTNLGAAQRDLGQLAEAVASCRRALAIKPDYAEALSNLGNALHDLGQLDEAVANYRRALEVKPNFVQAHSNLGNALKNLGQLNEAVASYRRALEIKPDFVAVYCDLGNALKDLGRLDEAAASYRRALEIKPDFVEVHNNLGNALIGLWQFDEAMASYRRALKIKPGFAEAHSNLGNALRDVGRLDDAVASYRRALALTPDFVEAHSNLGNTLKDLGRLDEAMASYRRALAINPDYAEAHDNLGSALKDLDRLDEAVVSYRRALEIKPDCVRALGNLGNALKDLGRLDEAVASYRRALAIKPNYTQAHSNLILTLLYHYGGERETVAEHRRWHCQHAAPLTSNILPHSNDRSPERRLRIGYISPDFREHVVGYNMLPLFERHNRRDFEIFGYAQIVRPDAVTRRFRDSCDHWCEIVPFSDGQLADRVRQDKIDILIDLALHLAKNRLSAFVRKPAPVQVSFAGYPGGTGLETIDYHLTDGFLEPPHADQAHGFDAPYRLPGSFWCYEGFAIERPVKSLPAIAEGRVTFGCLNNFCKFNDRTLQLWSRLMHGVAGSRLLMLAPKGVERERLRDRFEVAGLTPDQVEFVDRQSRDNYLALYDRIDVGLDTFPYNGHTTSLDSYWMGVPVVTLVGTTPVSRAGWGQLSNLGLAELAAETPDDYVRIASELAKDLPRLASLRNGLRERMRRSPLMDGTQFAHGIESAYRAMWRRWCAEQQPAAIG